MYIIYIYIYIYIGVETRLLAAGRALSLQGTPVGVCPELARNGGRPTPRLLGGVQAGFGCGLVPGVRRFGLGPGLFSDALNPQPYRDWPVSLAPGSLAVAAAPTCTVVNR